MSPTTTFPVTRFGKVLRARRARPPLGRRPKHQFSHAIFGLLVRFMRRLAFSRHLQVRHFSFLGLWDHSSRLQWGHNGRKTHAGNPLGNSGSTPPDLQALECGRRHFGARGGQAVGGRPPGTRSASLQGQIKSPCRWSGQAQACPFGAVGGARDRRVRHGPQRGSRSAAGQAAACARRQGAAGEGCKESEASQAAAQGRGTHSQSYSHWLECRGALGFRGSGPHSDTASLHQGRRSQSHISAQPRTKRCHHDAGQRPGSGGKKHRSGLSTPSTSRLGLGYGSLGRHSRPRHHAGCAVRRFGQAQSPQAAVVRRHRRCSHLRAHVASAGLERAVCEAPHDPRRHQDRPPGSGAQDGGLLGGPDIPFMVGQFCTLEPVQGPPFSGKPLSHSSFLANWRVGHSGIGACWSSWSREASGPRKGLRG